MFQIFLLVPETVTSLLATRTQGRLASMQTSANELGEDDGYVEPELMVGVLVGVCGCVGVWVWVWVWVGVGVCITLCECRQAGT